MAGPCARQSFCWNLPPTGKNEFAEAAPTESSGTPTLTPAVARALTPYSAIKMAGTRTCISPCQNLLPVKRGNSKPAEQASRALIDRSGFCSSTFIPAYAHCLFRFSLQ